MRGSHHHHHHGSMKRAVITGLGIVSSIGNNQQEVLASLREGRSGITFSQELKDSGMRSHVWGNVKLDTTGLIDRKVVRFMSDASIYAFLSMEQAIADAGLSPEAYQNNPRVGLIAGSGGGSPRFQVFGADAMRGPRGLKAVGPYVVTKAMASGVSACLATPFKIHGVNYSISSACATSAHCIGNAVEQIQLGKQDIVFAGGGEELCWEMACEFDAMGALSTKYNDTPEKASRTYDAHRDGFVIAGGGGMVVVEELEHALARGAHIYAEIVGYGATSDGADMVAPSGEGAVRCMKMAMHGVDTPIDYLNSEGTSTPVGDVKELAAIREVFGDKSPAISATKAMTGHSLGAAGVQEAIYSLLMLEHGFIAPSINIEELDEQAAGLNIVTETTDRELTTVMSNSFGFGGTNATLVMRKLKD
nr:Chain A, 3-OXOACYL-[ACYL-CARRIER-PROTEIN] SYNTHASE I [Escherichia coli]2BYY_B Chain B, 3-OXOACYL-[ACYL-CARRIER-PROTEIN] SYNTHASE I [Escherichia coli]2BYY_C Chain C, 3-OXOACYL-[ACYL-CARRIER-PROTEIN] SYNTHASE I [Escherichia coli]2BYY_D Chain D, 3-OXOACYL-[ACYL-CARRIER-PROTEIN] SYNTHASE I [Escherichia coli]2BZ3_A Chain A, 3-OXOACYL-[ACYL-CARRIER-PROTEIN] SYNTHASE I [Escherichia coli]2BZ3_B Chain B, 3-OXOACYL-[ACYL-CARRIER-PROTEIN] SYNTHASE I [Escherichia coli]2BZ3_C Chain C, 3-OXOACYL-[ACYL-C